MSLTIAELEQLQTQLTDAHLDYKMELVDGKIIIRGLSDYLSEEIIARLITFLNIWILPLHKTYPKLPTSGHLTELTSCFTLVVSALTSPQANTT